MYYTENKMDLRDHQRQNTKLKREKYKQHKKAGYVLRGAQIRLRTYVAPRRFSHAHVSYYLMLHYLRTRYNPKDLQSMIPAKVHI